MRGLYEQTKHFCYLKKDHKNIRKKNLLTTNHAMCEKVVSVLSIYVSKNNLKVISTWNLVLFVPK